MNKKSVLLTAFLISCIYVIWRLAWNGWDVLALAELGSRYSEGQAGGSEGYDGQFSYYIAIDPQPQSVRSHLDVPAYRFQRILFPILGRLVALGNPDWVPWTLLAINLVAQVAGTWAVASLLETCELPVRYALIYAGWVGLVAGVGLDMAEPLAYGLVAGGWVLRKTQRPYLGDMLLGLSLFAKETCLLFWAAALAAELLERRRWSSLLTLLLGGVAFAGWQVWLYMAFGTPGLASGGRMATPWEWIPFMGLWRVAGVSLPVFAVLAIVFVPTIVLPAVWSLFVSLTSLAKRRWHAESWALLFNAAFIAFLPFSTFREPLGLVRVATGLILALICYVSKESLTRPLKYGVFWLALLALLIRQ